MDLEITDYSDFIGAKEAKQILGISEDTWKKSKRALKNPIFGKYYRSEVEALRREWEYRKSIRVTNWIHPGSEAGRGDYNKKQ